MKSSSSTISCCVGALPVAQLAAWLVPSGHSHTMTSTLSYHSPFARVTCACMSADAPMNTKEMNVTSMTDTIIGTLRLRLVHVSDRMNRALIGSPP